ncbi:MAG: archaeal proteasome endopeptidase complex subunit alpha [Candidatus Thorarchaeota archaeon]
MFGNTQSYDIALTTFSPEGRLFQVEYAFEAVRKGTPILGIRCVDGVILTAALRKHSLQEPDHNDKIFALDDVIGAAIAGLSGDARSLIRYARELAQIHRLTFAESIPVKTLSKKLSDHIQSYTQQGGTRPYGVSMLLVGIDSDPQLYLTTPIGAFWSYKAHAVGIGAEQMTTILEKEYTPSITVDEALHLAVRIHKETLSTPLQPEGLIIAKVTTDDKKFIQLKVNEVQQLLGSV